tara:strand:+ start:1154 stop:1444 length:291 start_codon:yes stop_codon:yes gene_type:complete
MPTLRESYLVDQPEITLGDKTNEQWNIMLRKLPQEKYTIAAEIAKGLESYHHALKRVSQSGIVNGTKWQRGMETHYRSLIAKAESQLAEILDIALI